MKTESHYLLTKSTAAGIVVFVILLAVGSAYLGRATAPNFTETIALSTVTSTSIYTNLSVSTFTMTSNLVQISTTFSTIGVTLPLLVTVSGNASSKGLGTSATEIDFVGAASGVVFSGKIQSGVYAVQLKNSESYNVIIKFAGIIASVGSGQCSAGGLPLPSTIDKTITADWSC